MRAKGFGTQMSADCSQMNAEKATQMKKEVKISG